MSRGDGKNSAHGGKSSGGEGADPIDEISATAQQADGRADELSGARVPTASILDEDPETLTPMMRQYQQAKAENPDAILMFRLGDFFEMFFEDAVIASEILQITLTSRGTRGAKDGNKTPIPMCGVPFHAVKGYVARLVEAGQKVALCEQVELSEKGIARRELIRIVTPGMVVDDDCLDTRANNFLCAIAFRPVSGGGLAFIDAATGDFEATEVDSDEELRAQIIRSGTPEIVIDESFHEDGRVECLTKGLPHLTVSRFSQDKFDTKAASDGLKRHFHVSTLEGFGLTDMPWAIGASGAALDYLKYTQHADASHVDGLSRRQIDGVMTLDEATRANLEIFKTLRDGKRKGSLLGLLDRCLTTLGSRELLRWLDRPLLDLGALNRRQDAVEEFFQRSIFREDVCAGLRRMSDLDRLMAKLSLGQGTARELRSLANSLLALPDLRGALSISQSEVLQSLSDNLGGLEELASLLDRAIVDEPSGLLREGGFIRPNFSQELDRLTEISTKGKDFLLQLEAQERARTGIQSLKVRYNKVFGYYLEVTKANLDKVPQDYIRKQTMVGGERFITPALKDYEEQVLTAEEKRIKLEGELFEDLRRQVVACAHQLKVAGRAIAQIDVLQSLAKVAASYGYVRPELDDGETIHIQEGRHPVIERLLGSGDAFVPNDVKLSCDEEQIVVITGPNMAGKSTVMRQTALIVLMAQIGSFVPARQAKIGLVDKLFTRVGAADNIARGQSTFMVEMIETAAILHNATRKSLILLDEIGRGTSTYDGLSIAWAVAENIHERIGARTLFATHYHELTDLSREFPRVKNASIAVRELGERVVFLRKLISGAASRSYGIEVARLAGLPSEVIARAKEILANLERQELDDSGSPALVKPHRHRSGSSSQLSLFGRPSSTRDQRPPELPKGQRTAIETLQTIDPNKTTPLMALNILARLKELVEA